MYILLFTVPFFLTLYRRPHNEIKIHPYSDGYYGVL